MDQLISPAFPSLTQTRARWSAAVPLTTTRAAYDVSGNKRWVARYTGPANGSDGAAIAVDGAGNVYVTGSSQREPDGCPRYQCDDYATVAYDASGKQRWGARSNGPANGADSATAIAVDAAGNVYVTGSRDAGVTRRDYATLKYS